VLIISGVVNPHVFPNSEILDAGQSYTLLRTDTNRWIELKTNGMQMWVEVKRM
jgi:hypothetical protein